MDDEFRKVCLPYCIQQTKDGRFIVLNRYYKPLGVHTEEWVDYETHPSAHKMKGLTAAAAKKLSWDENPSVEIIYLYNDGTIPTNGAKHWDAYAARLKVLAKLTFVR